MGSLQFDHIINVLLNNNKTYLMYSVALDGIVISFERFNNFQDLLWNFKFGKLDDVTQRVVRLNGKNA